MTNRGTQVVLIAAWIAGLLAWDAWQRRRGVIRLAKFVVAWDTPAPVGTDMRYADVAPSDRA